ncbi:MAG: ABC transporter substrate-binding protein, partial [Betaproteobacteria bacterium]
MTTKLKQMMTRLALATAVASAAATPALAQEVKIGVVLSNTGTFAFVGAPVINAVKLAYEELMAANYFGNTKVTLMVEDNRSDRAEAITLINRMATRDQATIIIGPVSTGEAMAAAPVAVDLKIPLFTTATAPDVLKAGPWIFKSTETAEQFMAPLGNHVVQKAKPKNCFYVFIRDNEGYVRQKNVLRDVIAAGGVKTVGDESILAADSDFTALATKIVSSKADCLYVGTPPEQGANIVLQARQAGMPASTVLVGNTGMGSDRYVKAGGKAVDGTLFPAEFVPTGVNEMGRKFIAAYTKKYNMAPDSWAGVGYTMMLVTANAI